MNRSLLNAKVTATGMLLCLLLAALGNAETYYVSSSSGDDERHDGLSEGTPLKTLAAALSKASGAGDRVLLKRGDTFTERVVVRRSGISGNPLLISSYGTGPKPLISGADTITGWQNAGGNIYRAKTGYHVYHLYEEDKLLRVARYPNRGYLLMDDTLAGRITVFDSDGLNKPADYYKGADAVVRSKDWSIERKAIVASSPGQVTVESQTRYNGGEGYGYYIDNALSLMDTVGEWYYDPTDSCVYLYAIHNPAGRIFLAMRRDEGIHIQRGTRYVRIENAAFAYHYQRSVYCSNDNPGVEVISCDFRNLRSGAVELHGLRNVVRNCTVRDILNDAVMVHGDSSVIEQCTVRRVGLIPGYAEPWGSHGIKIGRAGTLVRCVVDSVGYVGVELNSFSIARENIVRNACLTLNDGGGMCLPFEAEGVTAERNFISGSFGNREGVPESNLIRANGFYFGGNGNRNITVRNNTMYNNRNNGIVGIDTYESEIVGNTVYNNDGELVFFDMVANPADNDNVVRDNIFYSVHQDRDVVYALFEKAPEWASYSGNYYCNPYSNVVVTEASVSGGRLYSPKSWTAAYDPTGKACPYSGLPYRILDTLSENLVTNGTFSEGIAPWTHVNNGTEIVASTHGDFGACLELRFSGQHGGFAAHGNVSVVAGHYYLVQATLMSDSAWKATFSIDDNSWNDAFKEVFMYGSEKGTITRVLKATRSITNGRFKIGLSGDPKRLFIDNVSVYDVAVEPENPLARSVLLANPTERDSTFLLQGNYIDVDGHSVGERVTVPAWSSTIVISTDANPAAADGVSVANCPSASVDCVVRGTVVHIIGGAQGKYDASLLDLSGRVVNTWKRIGSGTVLDLAGIGRGVYVLQVRDQAAHLYRSWRLVQR